jgi:hypothetical protein
MLEDFGPLLGWAVTTMASVAKIATPTLLVGKPMRTLGSRLFCAQVMSPRGEILGLPTKTLV